MSEIIAEAPKKSKAINKNNQSKAQEMYFHTITIYKSITTTSQENYYRAYDKQKDQIQQDKNKYSRTTPVEPGAAKD